MPEATALTKGEDSENGSKTNSTLDRNSSTLRSRKRETDSLSIPFTKTSELQASSDSVFSPIPEGEEDEEDEEEEDDEFEQELPLPMSKIGNTIPMQGTTSTNQNLSPAPIGHKYPNLDRISEYVVSIQNGAFSWEEDRYDHTLNQITTKIPKGKLTVIVGSIGSGKSSLISALLGEMKLIHGEVEWAG